MSDVANPVVTNPMVPVSQTQSAANAIATMPKSSELVPDKYNDDVFDDMATVGNYLPYIQLCGSSSEPAKRGQIPIGHHALFKGKSIIDLGKNVQCWVCAWRPMALLTTGEKPVSFCDPNSDGFKQIREIADKGQFGDGAMCGPQFLLYVPGHGFCTYFLNSKTAKNEAPNFKALIDQCAIISAKFIENKKYSWHGPSIVASSQQFDTPNIAEYQEVLQAFKNPVDSNVELVDKAKQVASGEKREM